MAKKKKKRDKRQKRSAPRMHPKAAPPAASRPKKTAVGKAAPTSVAHITESDLSTQYAYVMQDLKRIGVLAGSLFAFLIALSFVLR